MALTTSGYLGCGCLLLLVGLVASCTSLEDIELGVCGNAVLDPGEDCDGHAKNGVACGEAGTASACRYVCDFASEEPVCPDADYRCGASNVCARAGTGLVAGAELDLAGETVVVADFDGDKIDDVGVANSTSRELTLSFLGAGTVVELEQRFAIDSTTIAAANLRGNDRADLVVASEGSLVSFSSAPSERLLVNNASTLVPVDVTRLIGIPARVLPGAVAKEAFQPDTVFGGVMVPSGPMAAEAVTQVFFQNPLTFSPGEVPLAVIPARLFPPDVAAFFKARFYPVPDGADPCDELILLRTDDNSLTVLQMCIGGVGVFDNEACDEGACMQRRTLVAMPAAAFPLNLDADPEAEIVVVERDGDGDVSLETFDGATLLPEPAGVDAQYWLDALLASTESAKPTILAIDFINDDADLDFVREDGVYLSQRLSADPLAAPTYFRAAEPSGGDWVEATVGDFGGDNRRDVLASAGKIGDGLELRIGTESSYMNGVTIALAGAAGQLRAADFDGDGVQDVVFRERPGNDASDAPPCNLVDSVVVRFGARDSDVLADARVLSRVSGVEDIVAGPLPRFDTRDSISDFATASRCDGASEADISLFYGAVNRQILAPKVLLDDRDEGDDQLIVPYTPLVVAPFPGSPFVAALGEDRFKVLPDTADDVALFVLSPKEKGLVSGLLEAQSISLVGDEDHAGVPPSDFRIAVARLSDPETPAVVIVDPLHIHLIQAWPDLPEASDLSGAATIEEGFPSAEMPGGGGLLLDAVLSGDVTGDGLDDLIVAGRLDGEPVLHIHSDLTGDAAAFTELAGDSVAGGVLAVALLPRDALASAAAGSVDLVLALAGQGAVVVRFDGSQFAVIQSLPFPEITTLGVGDVDGDQFADVVLVGQDRTSVFLRGLRYAGDVSVEAGAQ